MADAVPKMPAGGAFGVWRAANFAMILEEAKKIPGGIGKGGVAKKASEIWKTMSEVDKAPFQNKFNEQLAAFREYQQSDSYVKPERKAKINRDEKKKKSEKQKDPNAPKKLCGGAYGIFANEVRARITADSPGKAVSVNAKAIKAEYDALSEAQKKVYQAQYEEKRAAYQVAFQEYCEKKKLEPTVEEGSQGGEDAEEKEDDVDAVVLSEASPQKKRKRVKPENVEVVPPEKTCDVNAPAASVAASSSSRTSNASGSSAAASKKPAEPSEQGPTPEEPPMSSGSSSSSSSSVPPKVETSPQKKEKASKASFNNTDPLLAEAKKEGLHLKLKAMMENPQLWPKGSRVLLDALRKAGGKVVQAKAALK